VSALASLFSAPVHRPLAVALPRSVRVLSCGPADSIPVEDSVSVQSVPVISRDGFSMRMFGS